MNHRLDPYSIRLFVSTAQAGSIVRAAEQEHIAASALSRRISDLEHAFGTPLLVRSPRGIALTDAGRLVLSRGMRFDAELQSLFHEVKRLGDELSGRVRLHANMSAVIGFLPERLGNFMAAHPGISVSLQEEDTRDVIRACLDDRADLGIGVETSVAAGLDVRHFADDPLHIVMPARHVLSGKPAVKFLDALQHPLIGVHEGGALDRSLRAQAQALDARFEPTVSLTSFDAVCRMVEAGLGIAVIPQSAATAYAGSAQFVRRPLDEPWAARRLMLYTLRRNPQPRAIQALMDSLLG
ncbi:LysR family transcriptional regulator [Xylophilus rhododendri]|uniref:LysR family transcriptional regulator n=1 Tax=Xylophilus rhododendri TaxID=2697032 RepID=UPI001E293989|nr:LysR substrate-binding domain-containing protein [Xylophilus rhododendri]